MSKATAVSGLLVIDKPLGLTSRDALNRAWRWLPRGTRVGHTGTLDPLASGVLVMCTGEATRLAEYVQRMEKVYRAEICLGGDSTTDDREGTLRPRAGATPPPPARIADTLRGFHGAIEQVPPDHSAAKAGGRRAYALARQGQEVRLPPRTVQVHDITLIQYDYPRLAIEVRCGKGTYIRALARDLGDRLGCGAYLENLRRTRVGPFSAAEALPLDADREAALARLLPLAAAVQDLRPLVLPDDQVARLHAGLGAPLPPSWTDGEELAIVSKDGQLRAVAQVDADEGLLLPRKVFVKLAADGRPA